MFVLVKWRDAVHPESGLWTLDKDLENDADLIVETCGFLVFKSADRLRVAVAVSDDGAGGKQYSGIMTIPRSCVVSMQEVRPIRKRIK